MKQCDATRRRCSLLWLLMLFNFVAASVVQFCGRFSRSILWPPHPQPDSSSSSSSSSSRPILGGPDQVHSRTPKEKIWIPEFGNKKRGFRAHAVLVGCASRRDASTRRVATRRVTTRSPSSSSRLAWPKNGFMGSYGFIWVHMDSHAPIWIHPWSSIHSLPSMVSHPWSPIQ